MLKHAASGFQFLSIVLMMSWFSTWFMDNSWFHRIAALAACGHGFSFQVRTHLKPILTVLLITPFLTELLSSNLPPSVFFNPVVFLCLATIGYGFPILLLREFAVRNRMGIPGLLCLGLLYGIINEGILAKTFYLAVGVPIDTFDRYGYVFGIAVPWAVTISVWHSLHAMLFPLFVTYYFFPAQRERPWLTGAIAILLIVPTVLINTLVFFTASKDRPPGLLSHYILMIACMGFLVWLATKAPRTGQFTSEPVFHLKPMAWGVANFLVLLLVPVLLSKARVVPALFYAYWAIVFVLVLRWLARLSTIPLMTCVIFAIGDWLITVLWAMPGALGRAGMQQLAADVVLFVAFALLLARLRRDRSRSSLACPGL